MGMDVFGISPTSETGEYFRRNVWGWHPLAEYIVSQGPEEIVSKCECWHSNDGDGLDAENAARLAEWLEASVKDGKAAAYAAIRDAELAAMPNEPCELCGGTGIRTDEVGQQAKMPERKIEDEDHPRNGEVGWCNGCNGNGSIRPWPTHYTLEVEDIVEFAAFLRDSGGFEIC